MCEVGKGDIRPEIKFLEDRFFQKSVSRSRDTLDKGLKWAELCVKTFGLGFCLACVYARNLM